MGPNNKLLIEIFSENNQIVVRNNIHLKHTPADSMGVGLKNLREQYNILAGKNIEVVNDNKYFTVKLPLL